MWPCPANAFIGYGVAASIEEQNAHLFLGQRGHVGFQIGGQGQFRSLAAIFSQERR